MLNTLVPRYKVLLKSGALIWISLTKRELAGGEIVNF